MAAKNISRERQREMTRRTTARDSIFLPALAGTSDAEAPRVVVRNDVHLTALESARQVLRIYHSERRRQL